MTPIASLRDDFENSVIDPPWSTGVSGSATVAETGGQAVFTLPSSTAGSHEAHYQSTNAAYDLTGDAVNFAIGTMVATGVAASAYMQLYADATNLYDWIQTSGTLKARKTVAGVTTDLFSVAWSSTTYKYLRIRESGGTVYFDSSTSASAGAAWTNRASTTIASAFAVTALYINLGASCGNVASPGSFKLDAYNPVLPAPSSTWRWTDADWQITNRLRPITLASDGGLLGVIVTADGRDASNVLTGTLRYFAGPLGSASGGYLALTEYASLAAAQTSAFPIPVDGRVDLPALVDARYIRLYHRSDDASAHVLYEYVPRRIVQADDIEAESIRAINIAASTITADKIAVIDLDAQHYITAGGGVVVLDDGGISVLAKLAAGFADLNAYSFRNTGAATIGGLYGYDDTTAHEVSIRAISVTAENSWALVDAAAPSGKTATATVHATSGTADANLVLDTPSGTSSRVRMFAGTISLGGDSGLSDTAADITGTLSVTNAIKPVRSSGSALFAIDGTSQGSALTIANNATATPFGNSNNFSGLLIITDTNVTGSTGIFVIGGGVVKVAESNGSNYTTTSGSAGKINVYHTAGVVTIENKNGSSITFNVLAIRSRTQL